MDGTRTNDGTPSFGGVAGTASGDSDTVTLKIYRPVAGAPDELVESRTTTRSSLDGSWSVTASPQLDDGHYWASWKEGPVDGADPAGVTSHL